MPFFSAKLYTVENWYWHMADSYNEIKSAFGFLIGVVLFPFQDVEGQIKMVHSCLWPPDCSLPYSSW